MARRFQFVMLIRETLRAIYSATLLKPGLSAHSFISYDGHDLFIPVAPVYRESLEVFGVLHPVTGIEGRPLTFTELKKWLGTTGCALLAYH